MYQLSNISLRKKEYTIRMEENNDETTFTSSYVHSHKFQVDINGYFHKEDYGGSVFGKKFSPLPGYLFQLRILNLDTVRFCVYLINHGEEEIEFMLFKVKSVNLDVEAEEKVFSLLPRQSMAVGDFIFDDFVVIPTTKHPSQISGLVTLHKDFECCLEIDFTDKGKTIMIFLKSVFHCLTKHTPFLHQYFNL
jgi:hypothetical protein